MFTCLSKILIADVVDIPYLLATSVNVAFGDLRSLRTLNTVATELSSKGEGIIFIECLLAVRTLISPCMIDDIAVSGAQNRMGYLLIRIVLHPACHMSTYRTLNPGLIKRDIDIHSVLSVGDGEILNVLSFQIEEL